MRLEGEDDPLDGGDEEIRFHLERQVEDLVAQGWSEEAARAEALRRFGNPARIERRLRHMGWRRRTMATGTAWWGGAAGDVAFAFRQMRRRPGFAAATVVILALGVGVAAAVFAVADAALLRPLPFPASSALVSVEDVQDAPGFPASLPEYRDWTREGADVLASSMAFVVNTNTLRVGDEPQLVRVGLVAGDPLAVLGVEPVVGRGFTSEERSASGWEGSALMLDEDFWRSSLGADPSVVGRTLDVDGIPTPVVGVMPREARLLLGGGTVAVWRTLPDLPSLRRGLHLLTVVARLAPGVDVAAGRTRMEAVAAGLRDAGVTRHGIALQSLRDALLGDTRRIALILSGAALLMLLVVCANLAHLFLARGWARAREFAVRGALGAGRGRLVRQLLTESTLLGLVGGAGGILVARGITGWVARAAGRSPVTALAHADDPRVVLFALGTSVLLGLVFGSAPARRAAGSAPGDALRGGTAAGTSRGRTRLRRALVGVEVALSAVLLVGAGLLVRTLDGLLHQDAGFSAGGVLTAELDLPDRDYPTPESRLAFWEGLTERLKAVPGVTDVALTGRLPLRGDTNGDFDIVGRPYPEGSEPQSKKRFAGPGYFEALGIPVLKGRAFLPSDRRGGPEVAVISASLAEKYWPGEDPVGRHIRFGWQTDNEQEIVGVVGDVRSDALDQAGGGTIYIDNDQVPQSSMSVVLRTGGTPELLAGPLRRAVREIDPGRPVSDVRTLEDIVRGSVSNRTTVMQLLGAFAALALLLAAVGVYAVAAQSVLARRREIGLRMAVGARPGGVVRRVMGEELRPVLLGLGAGVLGSVWMGRALAGMLYEVAPGDPTTLVAVVAVLLAASAAALALPALRAMRVDPADALRTE